MDRRESINASVNQDVEGIFNSKTYSQLIQLHKQINQKIASGDAVDIGKHHFTYSQLYMCFLMKITTITIGGV